MPGARPTRRSSETLADTDARIRQLASDLDRFRDRARRAEGWLALIEKEIEDKLIGPLAAARHPAVH